MLFNIEKYLENLPKDIENIDISHKNLKYIPNLSEFKNLKILKCSCNKLKKLPELNESLEQLYCDYNYLENLPKLNKNLKILYCISNKITKIMPLNCL